MNEVADVIEPNVTTTDEKSDSLLSKKERQKLYSKTFYNNHPEKLTETFFCVCCNKNISKFYKSKHEKTKIHIHNLESKSSESAKSSVYDESSNTESKSYENAKSSVSDESSNNESKSCSNNESSYYCSYCDKNIIKVNKSRHEKTINHMKCVSNHNTKDYSLTSNKNDKCKKYVKYVKYVNKNGDEVVKVYNQKKYNVKYLNNNPDKLKEKYLCEICNKMIVKIHKNRHEKTKFHILYSKLICEQKLIPKYVNIN
jgi:hypothetical protein